MGGGLHAAGLSIVTVTNSIFWDNIPDDIEFDQQNNNVTVIATSHDLTAVDPQFVNPAADDYRLNGTSPAIDNGDPNSALVPLDDQDIDDDGFDDGTGGSPSEPTPDLWSTPRKLDHVE